MSAIPPGASRRREWLEWLTTVHVAVLVILASWWFGGNSPNARTGLSVWASLGVILTLIAVGRHRSARIDLRPLRWLWPLALFTAIVIASTFNPSFREVVNDAQRLYVEGRSAPGWPSTARPAHTGRTLWFFASVYLACFNLLLVVRQRRMLRALLLAVAANALLLAIFGTVQKLLGSPGLFFGLVSAAQPRFFASFIYHNHWGAFTLLMTAIALGVAFHFARRSAARDVWHSPALAAAVAAMLLAASVPLTASRSCTLLILLLLGAAFTHWLLHVAGKRRAQGRRIALPVGAGLLVAGLVIAFAAHLAEPVIDQRVADTVEQIAHARAETGTNSRVALYRDTWNMAREKLWFGWGMGAYPTVFFNRNTQRHRPDGFELHFHDAHSDWLQSASEVGLVGTALLGLCGLVPLYACRRSLAATPLVVYPLFGCGIVLAYAWLEFPFGNRAVVCSWWLCFFAALQYSRLRERTTSAAAPPSSAHPSFA